MFPGVMIKLESVNAKLMKMISRERYEHSLGVQKTAAELALRYGVSKEKASIAGMVHDCAKGLSNQELISRASLYGIPLDDLSLAQPGLLHGPVGACMAKDIFDIQDEEILHSIRFHTTGCKCMSVLDKIIYLADYIEPGRNFPGVSELRDAAYKNLDRGVLMAIDNTIKYVVDKGWMIDIKTIEARNSLLKSMT